MPFIFHIGFDQYKLKGEFIEAATGGVLLKKVFLKISQYSQ